MRMLLLAAALFAFACQAVTAGEFDWKQCEGQTIKVMLNQHPYAEGMLKKLDDFEKKTGIKVSHTIIPEENYFDKLTTSLSSRLGEPDVFMTGAYQTWEFSPPGYLQDLDVFLNDGAKTAPDYNAGDFFDGIISSLRWDKTPGHKVGSGPLWALPLGFEAYCLSYNKKVFERFGVQPPKTTSELLEVGKKLNKFDGEGTYGVALRGTRNWATIHPAYMSLFTMYGAQDLAMENGRLVSKVNSPEAVAMTEYWVELIRETGSPTWSSYPWYQCTADLGAGKAAMMWDADALGYFVDAPGASNQSGNIGEVPSPLPDGKSELKSNLWVWSLGMNNDSKLKDAAWMFIQYFTHPEFQLFSVTDWKSINPPRRSVFENPAFQAKIGDMTGYAETFEKTIAGSSIFFTPNPYFFELTTEWAATLQDLVAGKYPSTQAAMDDLKRKMDIALEDIELD